MDPRKRNAWLVGKDFQEFGSVSVSFGGRRWRLQVWGALREAKMPAAQPGRSRAQETSRVHRVGVPRHRVTPLGFSSVDPSPRTSLGDPIEVGAIRKVQIKEPRSEPLLIASSKRRAQRTRPRGMRREVEPGPLGRQRSCHRDEQVHSHSDARHGGAS